jgi:cellulose synthase operon protein YhjQ
MEKHGNDSTVDRELDPIEPLARAVRGAPRSETSPETPDLPATEPPEDVAILYSWANLQGARYRDFSATRREYRAQMRRHAAELLREQELRNNLHLGGLTPEAIAANSILAAPSPSVIETPDPEPEPPLTTPSATESYHPAKELHGSEPQRIELEVPELEISIVEILDAPILDSNIAAAPTPLDPDHISVDVADPPVIHDTQQHSPETPYSSSPEGLEITQAELSRSGEISLFRALVMHADQLHHEQSLENPSSFTPPPSASAPPPNEAADVSAAAPPAPPKTQSSAPFRASSTASDIADGPAWLNTSPASFSSRPQTVLQSTTNRLADTLQSSKERVASRWYALKGVFHQNPPNVSHDFEGLQHEGGRPPVLAVFSLAGGVGKTSLVATLGRTLSSLEERVLLADTTTHGLLPFYYGASEVHPGRLRTFWPPAGCKDAPVQLVNYDVDRRSELQTQQTREERKSHDSVSQDKLLEDLTRHSRGSHRILLDLAATSSWVVRRVARMNPTILLPIAADMNSVITLRSVTRFFQSILDSDGKPLQPYFILNQFDHKLPLHLDVREVLVQQLGERLLPFVIHRSPAMSEALAEGMTLVDYQPDSILVHDFVNLANWIRSISAPVSGEFDQVRWSEK